jgi:2-(1,2-epoxy-1,2-dihydrophenyl)acetyl-CoA isomerase
MSRPVLVDADGAVCVITLNRPHVRNAIDLPMRIALAEAIEAADTAASVRAIVLTGAGGAFCSGGDIATMARMAPELAAERIRLAQRVIRAIWNTRKPVLAAVEGSAVGAGTSLAAACDRVVAAHDARFATTFTNVGLAGDMGVFASLPARIGVARTRQMLLSPTPITATEALNWGLVDILADPGRAVVEACADAHRLAAGAADALGVVKAMLAAAPTMNPLDVLDLETEEAARLFDTDDFAEGISAFRDRRRPHFGARQGIQP